MNNETNEPNLDDDTFEQESQAVQNISRALKPLSPEARQRVIQSVMTLIQSGSNLADRVIPIQGGNYSTDRVIPQSNQNVNTTPFSEDRSMSPKEFIMEKDPGTDVERVACLAYYLANYKGTPHFKTIDISKLNTEAAQRKFANATKTLGNALTYGYLVPGSKGHKQLSGPGEKFVQALPDRIAAKKAMTNARPKRKQKRKTKNDLENN